MIESLILIYLALVIVFFIMFVIWGMALMLQDIANWLYWKRYWFGTKLLRSVPTENVVTKGNGGSIAFGFKYMPETFRQRTLVKIIVKKTK